MADFYTLDVVGIWICSLFTATLYSVWGCSVVPISHGERRFQTGMFSLLSSSIGQCTAQCYHKYDCTGANYIEKRHACELLTLPIHKGDSQETNDSVHITVYKSINSGSLRLADKSSYRDGLVQMYLNDTWGTICDQDWDDVDATVLCRQMGFCRGRARMGPLYPHFDASDKRTVHRHAVACNGTEATLDECPASDGSGNCSNERSAGVFCTGCSVRLVDGDSPSKGRVEVLADGVMGSICDNGWDDKDANVVCQELGYCYGTATSGGVFPAGTGPIHLDDVRCDGFEQSIFDCTADKYSTVQHRENACTHDQDAGVECEYEYPCVRLLNGTDEMSGRVEVFMNSDITETGWGTICDDYWKDPNAVVICRQLGYCGGTAKRASYFGSKYGDMHMDDVKCTGEELHLFACPRSPTVHNCGHQDEDAAVICNRCEN